MLSPDIALSFTGAAILLALAPGPDNLFVLALASTHGRKAGMLVVLGLCTGLIGHTLAVALGLAAVFAASPTAFFVVRLCGVVYLLYLAWQSWCAAAQTPDGVNPYAPGRWALYRRGIVMNLTNPKVTLFFLAFLPQFTSPEHGSLAAQSMTLGGLFMLSTLVVFGAIAWSAGAIGERLRRRPGIQTLLHRLTAVVFVGLAIRLARG